MITLTNTFLAHLCWCAAIASADNRLWEDGFIIVLVSQRDVVICFISSVNFSQDLLYLVAPVSRDCCPFSARRFIASKFHADDRDWFHAMGILALFGPPIWSSSYFWTSSGSAHWGQKGFWCLFIPGMRTFSAINNALIAACSGLHQLWMQRL